MWLVFGSVVSLVVVRTELTTTIRTAQIWHHAFIFPYAMLSALSYRLHLYLIDESLSSPYTSLVFIYFILTFLLTDNIVTQWLCVLAGLPNKLRAHGRAVAIENSARCASRQPFYCAH